MYGQLADKRLLYRESVLKSTNTKYNTNIYKNFKYFSFTQDLKYHDVDNVR